jgi:hypothetical protein
MMFKQGTAAHNNHQLWVRAPVRIARSGAGGLNRAVISFVRENSF